MTTIKEWIEVNKENISHRLYLELKSISNIYTYMEDLSVIKSYKRLGIKSIIQLLKIYPSLVNEVGFVCTETVKYYIKKKKYEI